MFQPLLHVCMFAYLCQISQESLHIILFLIVSYVQRRQHIQLIMWICIDIDGFVCYRKYDITRGYRISLFCSGWYFAYLWHHYCNTIYRVLWNMTCECFILLCGTSNATFSPPLYLVHASVANGAIDAESLDDKTAFPYRRYGISSLTLIKLEIDFCFISK